MVYKYSIQDFYFIWINIFWLLLSLTNLLDVINSFILLPLQFSEMIESLLWYTLLGPRRLTENKRCDSHGNMTNIYINSKKYHIDTKQNYWAMAGNKA